MNPSKRYPRCRRRALLATACATVTLSFMAAAQAAETTYPERAVRLVVPYTPGGATDVIGRVVAQGLTQALGQSVVVENKPGAAGNLGAAYVAKERPDGYTLMLGALTSHSINSVLQAETAGFDMETSFAPVSLVGRVPLLVAVGPSFKGNDLSELIAAAKANPGKLNYGSSGNGSPQHLAAEMFKRQAEVDLLHVPYRGSSPALNDLIAGQVDVVFDTLPAAQSFIRSERLRALAVTTAERQEALPDVPTSAEAGMPDFEVSSLFGVLAPAGTPEPVIMKLNAALGDMLSQQSVQDALHAQGTTPVHATPAETKTQIDAEVARWRQVIEASGIEAD